METVSKFTWCASNGRLHINKCSQSLVPLINSHAHNVLVKTAPELNQLLFQFINVNAVDVCLVNTFLHLHGHTDLISQWDDGSGLWRVQRPKNPAE